MDDDTVEKGKVEEIVDIQDINNSDEGTDSNDTDRLDWICEWYTIHEKF